VPFSSVVPASRALPIALAAVVALVLARSMVFLLWEHAGFDADQAIYGLMAKHLGEGRAFPMFAYSFYYMLAVQAWITAPLVAVFGASVAVLKVPVVLINIATGCLLVYLLHRDAGLRPVTAVVSSLFFLLAPPALAVSLVETGGANPEPLLYVLLLWVLRGRPLAFGLVFGLGFLHREFTLYGVTAIAGLALLDDRRITSERLRFVALTGVGYMIVWQLVQTGFVFSTPFGPGSPVVAALGGGQNDQGLAGRVCWVPETIVPGLAELFGSFLGATFGGDNRRLSAYGLTSELRTGVPGVPAFWPVLGVVFACALARTLWLSVRHRTPIWRGRGAIGAFLLVVGLQSGGAYVVGRCGQLDAVTFRYVLLTVYIGVGIAALFFAYETSRVWRRVMIGLILVWTLASATVHARLLAEYLYREPPNTRRELVTYLLDHNIRYARADYWTAYVLTFFSGERVIVASTDYVRINSYQREVEAHRAEAVTVQREPCASGKGAEAVPATFWVCPE
jgi:hypothetical protein